MQLTTGSFYAGLADSLCTSPEIFPEDLHRPGILKLLMLFEAVLQWALVHSQYLSTLRFLMLFEAVLRQVLVHHLSHLSLYQQPLGFLVLF